MTINQKVFNSFNIKFEEESSLDDTTYEIPIKDFERDMNTESSKDKKEKILDVFRNHNELKSEKEYNDIKFQLHYACREGYLELIKILLSETIEDESKNFLIKIDKTNKTAFLIILWIQPKIAKYYYSTNNQT